MTPENQAVVRALSAVGISTDAIAAYLGINRSTLDKYYQADKDQGRELAACAVVSNLYRMATGQGREALTAAIFWCKTRLGWREVNRVEHTGEDGGPIKTDTQPPEERLREYVETARMLSELANQQHGGTTDGAEPGPQDPG